MPLDIAHTAGVFMAMAQPVASERHVHEKVSVEVVGGSDELFVEQFLDRKPRSHLKMQH